jgi:hypothetical protein
MEIKFWISIGLMIDPIKVAKRFISKPKFAGKLYTKYERQDSVRRPGKRAFGRANSGLVFQSAQFIDPFSSPLLLLFYQLLCGQNIFWQAQIPPSNL